MHSLCSRGCCSSSVLQNRPSSQHRPCKCSQHARPILPPARSSNRNKQDVAAGLPSTAAPSRRALIGGAITWWMLEDSGNAWQGGAQAASEGEAGLQQQQQPSSSSQGPGTPSPSDASNGKSKAPEQNGRRDLNLTDEEARQLLDAEEEKRKQRRRQKKGRIRELEEARALIAENQLILLGKEAELLQKEQTLDVLKEQLDLERKLRALLTKEKEKAEEEAALAMGLCTGSAMLP